MVADSLSRKAAGTSIKDVCLNMTVITPLLEQIREAQVEAMQEEYWKSKRIVSNVFSFYYDNRGLLTLHRRVWVPYFEGTRQILKEEVHK